MPETHSTQSRDRLLQTWRDRAGYTSWAAFARAAALSRYRLDLFRQARLERLTVKDLISACSALGVSPLEYLSATEAIDPAEASETEHSPTKDISVEDISVWQRSALDCLEPLLRQYPTARYAAEHRELSARQVLPLLLPLERLLEAWNVEPLGCVGETAAFDPTQHELLSDADIATGEPIEIRYLGYRYCGAIWLKAQVRVR
ncbi:MAG: hypothetical protein AAF978_03070 [Cyanobacteria bacterium P01_E01_bin.48]